MTGRAPGARLPVPRFVRATSTLPEAVRADVRRRHTAIVARLLDQGAAVLAPDDRGEPLG